MIIFYTVIFIYAYKYREVPFDLYQRWREEKKFVDESLKPGAGIDSGPSRPRLRRVK